MLILSEPQVCSLNVDCRSKFELYTFFFFHICISVTMMKSDPMVQWSVLRLGKEAGVNYLRAEELAGLCNHVEKSRIIPLTSEVRGHCPGLVLY